MRRIVVSNGVYHVMSRTVNGEVMFGPEEMGVMRRMMNAVAYFSGVKVLTFCFMKNHFHLLIRVPDGTGEVISDEEFVHRYRVLHQASEGLRTGGRAVAFAPDTPEQVAEVFRRGGEAAADLRVRLRRRMYDLSEFMKTLKQRISIWMNVIRERFGPLWCGRFKSVLVQGRKEVLRAVGAYIDLNPLRAGLVQDAGAYPHSGFGQALRGDSGCCAGLREVTGMSFQAGNDRALLEDYGEMLRKAGARPRPGKAHVEVQDDLSRQESYGGEFSAALSRGAVLGSTAWVKEQAEMVTEFLYRKRCIVPKVIGHDGLSAGKHCRKLPAKGGSPRPQVSDETLT